MNTQDNGLFYYLPFYNSVLTAKGDSSDISRSLITDTIHLYGVTFMVRPPRWDLSVGRHNSRLATIFLQGVCGNRQESDMRNLLVHPYALTYGDHRRTPLRGECQIRWTLRCTSSSLHHLSYHRLSIECRGHHWRVSQEGGTFYSTITPPVLPQVYGTHECITALALYHHCSKGATLKAGGNSVGDHFLFTFCFIY